MGEYKPSIDNCDGEGSGAMVSHNDVIPAKAGIHPARPRV
jgi:hypothetical protein